MGHPRPLADRRGFRPDGQRLLGDAQPRHPRRDGSRRLQRSRLDRAAGSSWYKRSALRFGGDDFVTVADSPTLEPKSISVGAVVRATSSPGVYRYVVSKGTLQCSTASYGLYTGRNGGLSFYVSNGIEYTVSADADEPALERGLARRARDVRRRARPPVRRWQGGRHGHTDEPLARLRNLDNDGFYIGDYHGRCANPLGFVGDIDAVAVANRAITWSGS